MSGAVSSYAMIEALREFFLRTPSALLWGLAGVLGLLALGAAATAVLPRFQPGKDFADLKARVASWWVMAILLGATLLLGWGAVTLLFLAVSFVALREFLSLAPTRREDRLVLLLAYAAVPLSYATIAANDYILFLLFIPVWCFLTFPFLMAVAGQTRGYLSTVASIQWGLVTCVYNLGYVAMLMRTPASETPQAGAAGMVFFLLLTTEANDVAQYVCGKLLGRRKILPTVSPNKTWEGFLGGWAITAAMIWLLGPLFTPLKGMGLATAALALPVAGFAGDVTMSAIKRDLGVKDTSRLIPGHGGLLDRADSLTFTAPVYFHILAYFALVSF